MSKTKSCPICGISIFPSLLDHLPPKLHYRQYRCENCHSWLSISWRTRLQAGVFAIVLMMTSATLFSRSVSWIHKSSDASTLKAIMTQPGYKFMFVALFTAITVYLIAYIMRLLAHWIPSSDM